MPPTPNLGWQPKNTWLLVVGLLEWKYPDYFASFPKENRRDQMLVDFFREQGVPDKQIVYLQDKQATTKKIQQTFEQHSAAVGADDLLVVYFCGHGAKNDDAETYFVSYDADGEENQGWLVKTILPTMKKHFRGARALFLVDCCYSGSLTDAVAEHKGGNYACLASSLSSELSTGNWTFTEGVLYGLRGQAFVDGDGNNQITLQEFADQLIESMAFAEEQISTFAVSGSFNAHMVMAKAQPRKGPQIGRRVEAYSEDDWYPAQIIDVRGDSVKVHFFGYEESDQEWLTGDYIREAVRTTYPSGTAVEVKWKRKWYPATVLKSYSGIHYIQYDEYAADWNEWVALKRIRLPK